MIPPFSSLSRRSGAASLASSIVAKRYAKVKRIFAAQTAYEKAFLPFFAALCYNKQKRPRGAAEKGDGTA
ncbi:hypothetical protein [Agathobaculum sp.]|uniref:hypothetical protein n=1 Tax=Agathobaculum sp. TaxID=2048138 RepID=UPI002A80BBE8|nr:hypothetical protein [Agathobaculum sp.]MDY3618643.1 hypothetical protein [Agathobaculum sp.]